MTLYNRHEVGLQSLRALCKHCTACISPALFVDRFNTRIKHSVQVVVTVYTDIKMNSTEQRLS